MSAESARAVSTAVARGEPPPPMLLLGSQDAREVATVVGYLAAYNTGSLGAALAMLDVRQARYYDCDYSRRELAVVHGKESIAGWLRQRFADHDQLLLESVSVGPDSTAVAVRVGRRTSGTLRALGFPSGIVPQQTGKWIVAPDQHGGTGRLRQVMLADSSDDCIPA